ncbi:MAG TPA: heparin lyase I family protein [Blastocatellia bacterium]|nr:heparin lyase I family protein [Blastocatellia bacterium]
MRKVLCPAMLALSLCLYFGWRAQAAGWVGKWDANPDKQGLKAFEGIEDDRTKSHAEATHIYVKDSAWRVDMHLRDRDKPDDRQRNEVKGMKTADGTDLAIERGQTWRFTYSMYIPASLTATDSFTHIMQQKVVSDNGSSGAPLVTLSLHNHDGTPSVELRLFESGEHFNPIPLAPLQDKWIDVEFEFKFDSASNGGSARMVVKSEGKVITDKTKTGVSLFRDEGANSRVRPKWGIYRSVKSSGLRDCYLLLKNMKAYQWQ